MGAVAGFVPSVRMAPVALLRSGIRIGEVSVGTTGMDAVSSTGNFVSSAAGVGNRDARLAHEVGRRTGEKLWGIESIRDNDTGCRVRPCGVLRESSQRIHRIPTHRIDLTRPRRRSGA